MMDSWRSWPAFKAFAEGQLDGLEVASEDEDAFGASFEIATTARGAVVRLKTRGGFVASRTPSSIARPRSNAIGICLARSGSLTLRMDGETIAADTGDALACDAGRIHDIEVEPASDGQCALDILSLTPNSALRPNLDGLSAASFHFSRSDPARAIFVDFATRVVDSAAALDGASLRPFEDATAALLEELLISNHLERGAGKNPALARVLDAMSRRARDPGLRLETIAAEVGMSPRSIQRLFREIGATPSKWLEERRLSRITAELASPAYRQRSITEIANSWGYGDLSHFSKIFKKKYGVSPSVYRRDALAAKRDCDASD